MWEKLGNGSAALGAILTRTYAKMPKCLLRCKIGIDHYMTPHRSLGHHCGNTSRMKSQKVWNFQLFCMQHLWLLKWVTYKWVWKLKPRGQCFESFNNAPVIVASLGGPHFEKKMTKDWRAQVKEKLLFSDTLARKFPLKWGEEVGNGFKFNLYKMLELKFTPFSYYLHTLEENTKINYVCAFVSLSSILKNYGKA